MKNSTNQSKSGHLWPLKSILTLFLLVLFSSTIFAQLPDPPGFNAEKERQEGIKKGVHADELDGYVKKMRNYYAHLEKVKTNGGTTLTMPPISFNRKSSVINCVGDFENGAVPPWTGYTATNVGINTFVTNTAVFTTGTATNRHTIETPGIDPNVFINRVNSGNYGLRLGNDINGSEAERVARTVTVTGTCFSFWYALVFQEPNHAYDQQPFFMFRIRDSTGAVISSYIREASNTAFFTQAGTRQIIYRDWTKHTVNLPCEYVGKNVTIDFTTGDCSLGLHFGYAYIDDVCFEDCCTNCQELFNSPGAMATYPMVTYKGSTDSSCCYKFNWIFDPDIFKCSPYGVKIYEDGAPTNVFVNYLSDSSLLWWKCEGQYFDASVLDFCIKRSQFTSAKTIRIAFLNKNGQVICDTTKLTLQPCHSSSSNCNCSSLFADSNFANTPIIKKDTAASSQYECCFDVTPFRDSTIIQCPYYGIRVYRDTVGGASNPFLDSFKTGTPMGGPGANMGDSGKLKFCVNSSIFSSGAKTLRLEYLDSTGKVICSKTEKVNCEHSCCDNVAITVTKTSNCCIRITGFLANCFKTKTIELSRYTDTGWISLDTVSTPSGIFVFDPPCGMAGDTIRYMIFLKDSAGKIICAKEVIQICSCCEIVGYTATYIPPPPGPFVLDRCCWDIHVVPAASPKCNIWNWKLYDSLHQVDSTYPLFLPPSPLYQGRHCTPMIHTPYVLPGHTVTITYCIKRYLAVYDNFGQLLCIKPIELCCTRTYSGGPADDPTNPGPLGLMAAPNPFTNTTDVQAELPVAMGVSLSLTNSIGVEVFSQDYGMQDAGTFSRQLNLGHLPQGVYSLSINNGQATIQIVKE